MLEHSPERFTPIDRMRRYRHSFELVDGETVPRGRAWANRYFTVKAKTGEELTCKVIRCSLMHCFCDAMLIRRGACADATV